MKKRSLLIAVILTMLLSFTGLALAGEQATKDECIAKCKAAAALFKEKGQDEAFKILNDKGGPFVWKDSYVFAMSAEDGVILAHPIKAGLVGKNLMGLKDVNGTMIFVELLKAAKAGEGWVNYMWPKPGEKKPSPKHSYIYTAPGTSVAFGAGIYD